METMTTQLKPCGNSNNVILLMFFAITFLILGCSSDDSPPPQEPPVVANFSANVTKVGIGGSINFTDMSINGPTSWEWTFEGGTPASSTQQNPTVTYSALGSFSVSLKVSNSTSQNTKSESGYIIVECMECTVECPGSCTQTLQANQTIDVNGVSRQYDVLLPFAYSYTENMPVIIDLHGTYSTKEVQRQFSEFDAIADANNIIMVWPQALPFTDCGGETYSSRWNANFVESPDDIGFIDALIDKLIADYKVNPKRIYLDGLSNGGFMAYSVACALSDKVAAIASVAGTMSDNLINTCNPSRAVPILEIHGTADNVCNYGGYNAGCEGHQSSVDNTIAFWLSKGGCNSTYDTYSYPNIDTTDGCTARMLTYQGCNNMVKLVIVDGGGHFWPGSEKFTEVFSAYEAYLSPWNFDIEASQVIWDFFKEHSLP